VAISSAPINIDDKAAEKTIENVSGNAYCSNQNVRLMNLG
jgi:hypothetical protein